MIKLTFCLRRLPKLTLVEFQDYWFDKHAPLVAKHRDALRIRRYVQMHTTDTAMNAAMRAIRGGPEGYDGVAELWWDSIDDIMTNDSAEARAAGLELLEDERRFIDLENSPLWFGNERTIFSAPNS